jgi:hypothetical protein
MAINPDTGQETGDGKQGDKRTVPLAALESETSRRQAAEVEAAELRGQLTAHATAPAPVETLKVVSEAELDTAVREGRMTESEASTIREGQKEVALDSKIAGAVATAVTTQAAVTEVGSEIDRYKGAVPDIMEKGTEGYKKLTTAFTELVKLGMPSNRATELAAARQVYGPIDALEAVGEAHDRDTHQETGGRAPPGNGGGEPLQGKPAGMSADEDRFYQRQIDSGIYKDWDAVGAELKFANAALRKKHGATIA